MKVDRYRHLTEEYIISSSDNNRPVSFDSPIYVLTEPKYTDVGTANLICPYCQGKLKRFPQRKTKCPYCSSMIFSRSRPFDRRKVLLNEEEMDILEKEWGEFNKHQQLTRIISSIMPDNPDLILTTTSQNLQKTLEKEPTIVEILWEINSQIAQENLKKGMFEQYRYSTLFFADILTYDSRDLEAMGFLLQVIFLDLNGVSNSGTVKGRKPFNLKSAGKAIDLLTEVRVIRTKLNLAMDEVESVFMKSAEEVCSAFKPITPPLSSEEVWSQISRSIE